MFQKHKNEKLKKKINQMMQDYLSEHKVGAAAICVQQNGKTLFCEYYGNVRLHGTQPPDGKSLYRLASMTKPITAVAVLQQVAKGKIDLDKDIAAYIPAFADLQIGTVVDDKVVPVCPADTYITARQLLTHTSGVGSGACGEKQFAAMPLDSKDSLETATAYYAEQALQFKPGTKQEYSPIFAFDLLARLVEVTSGMPFNRYIEENICQPLGMHDTTFQPSVEQESRIVYLHTRTQEGFSDDATPADGCVFGGIPNSRCCGGAGLVGSLDDYLVFAQMLLQNGSYNGKQILPPAMVRQMQQPQVSDEIMPGSQKWGLGVRVITKKSSCRLPVGTFGWSGAYGTHFWVDPKNGITAVMMRNSLYDGGAGARATVKFEKCVYTAI